MSPIDLVQDQHFYVHLENCKPVLKKPYFTGYYSQIQLAIELLVLIHVILLFTLEKV